MFGPCEDDAALYPWSAHPIPEDSPYGRVPFRTVSRAAGFNRPLTSLHDAEAVRLTEETRDVGRRSSGSVRALGRAPQHQVVEDLRESETIPAE